MSQHQVVILLLLVSPFCYGQNIPDLKLRYPGYSELILKELQSYHFSVKNNKPSILQDNYNESIILLKNGIHNNSEQVSYSQLVPLISYDGYTTIKMDGKDKKIPAIEVKESSESSGSVFHSDVKSKKLLFTNLDIGARKIYSYRSEFLDPFLLHRFVFTGTVPVEESVLEITTDNDLEIGYKIFNNQAEDIKFSKTVNRKKTTYTWTRKRGKPVKPEPNSPGLLHIAPHIMVYLKSYKVNNKNIAVLGTVNNLYSYYKNFVSSINKTEDAELLSVTKNIVSNLNTDEEKIKAIFYWVKDNIKYVAFEYGYDGFIPREGGLVNQRKFGDCKDMSSIIATMSGYAGLKDVNLCWIGTRRLPYTYEEISTPAVDDHMIASIVLNGKTIFLDATDGETAFGLPTGFIQGKEALIEVNDSFRIVKVPVVSPEENLIREKLKIHIEGKTIIGDGYLQLSGLSRSNILNSLGDAADNIRFEQIKGLVLKGNNKFKLKEYKEKNIKNRDLPYGIDYNFTLENYLVAAGKETYLSLMLEKPFEKNVIENERESKYDFDILTRYKYQIELLIPNEVQIKSLPIDLDGTNELMDYTIKYTQKDRLVTMDLDIKNKKLTLDKQDFELWNSTIKILKSKYQEALILTNT